MFFVNILYQRLRALTSLDNIVQGLDNFILLYMYIVLINRIIKTRASPMIAIYALQMFVINESHTNALNSFI